MTTEEEAIAEMSEDRLAKLMDMNAEYVVELVLDGKYIEALETAKYYQLLAEEMGRR